MKIKMMAERFASLAVVALPLLSLADLVAPAWDERVRVPEFRMPEWLLCGSVIAGFAVVSALIFAVLRRNRMLHVFGVLEMIMAAVFVALVVWCSCHGFFFEERVIHHPPSRARYTCPSCGGPRENWFDPCTKCRRIVDAGENFKRWSDRQSARSMNCKRELKEGCRRRIWRVPVVSCTAGDPVVGKKGYVFISGFDRSFDEGAVIAPSGQQCGYEIVSVGERTVWLRVVMESEGDDPMGVIRLPEFARVEGESLVRNMRRYMSGDAFPLASGGWMLLDSFLPPDGAAFKILDENRREMTTLLCVVPSGR